MSRVVGMFCLATGVVLDTLMGPLTTSEQALCGQLLLQAQGWLNWVLVTAISVSIQWRAALRKPGRTC